MHHLSSILLYLTTLSHNIQSPTEDDEERIKGIAAAKAKREKAKKEQEASDLLKKINELSVSKTRTKSGRLDEDLYKRKDDKFENRPRPYTRDKYNPKKKAEERRKDDLDNSMISGASSYKSPDQDRLGQKNTNIATGYTPGGGTAKPQFGGERVDREQDHAVPAFQTGYKPREKLSNQKSLPGSSRQPALGPSYNSPQNNEPGINSDLPMNPTHQKTDSRHSDSVAFKGWGDSQEKPSKTEEQLGTNAWGGAPINAGQTEQGQGQSPILNFSKAVGAKTTLPDESPTVPTTSAWGTNTSEKIKAWGDSDKNQNSQPTGANAWQSNNSSSQKPSSKISDWSNDIASSNNPVGNEWSNQTRPKQTPHENIKENPNITDWATQGSDSATQSKSQIETGWNGSDSQRDRQSTKHSKNPSHVQSQDFSTDLDREEQTLNSSSQENRQEYVNRPRKDQNSERRDHDRDTNRRYDRDSNYKSNYRDDRDRRQDRDRYEKSDRTDRRSGSYQNNRSDTNTGYKPSNSSQNTPNTNFSPSSDDKRSHGKKYNPALDDLNERGQRKNFDKANVKISSADQLCAANFEKQRRNRDILKSRDRGQQRSENYRGRRPSERSGDGERKYGDRRSKY